MTIPQRDIDLINGYCNGSLTDEDFSELESRLRESHELRQILIEYRSIESAMPLALASGAMEQTEASSTKKSLAIRRLKVALLATAAGFLLTFGLYFLRPSGEPQIATVRSLSGSVRWIAAAGRIHDDLRVGSVLTGGTIEGLSADASAAIEFSDGTTVTLSHLFALTISDDVQKQLYLRHGDLSLTVVAQPQGKPLTLLTQTASLEAGETRCEVSADADCTELTVNEGLVHVTELVDGQSTDVPAAHQIVAAIDGRGTPAAWKVLPPTHQWIADLQAEVMHGKLLSAEQVHGLEMRRAIASLELTATEAIEQFARRIGDLGDDGGVVFATPVRMGLGVASMVSVAPTKGHASPVVLVKGNRLRIRGSVRRPAQVTFGFEVRDPTSDRHVVENVDGPFEFVLPVDEFRPEIPGVASDASPFGRRLTNVFCATNSSDAGLEITHVELLAPQ